MESEQLSNWDDFQREDREESAKVTGRLRCVITDVEETTSKASGLPMIVISVRPSGTTFKVKTYLDPFIFLSENDVIAGIQQLVTCGAMSTKTATELAYNIGYSSPDEVNRILQEAHDELVAEAQVPAMETSQQTEKSNPVAESRNAGQ